MFKDLVVPENGLKETITELLDYCDTKEDDGELGRTAFSEPVSEEEILNWEKETGVAIPGSYKQWLAFSGDSTIDGTVASFYSPKNFRTEYVPEDLIIIGEQIGDGEVVCFSKVTGEIVSFYEGSINYQYGTFDKVLKEVVRLMGKPEEESEEEKLQRLKTWKANLESKLDGTEKDQRRIIHIKELEKLIKSLEG